MLKRYKFEIALFLLAIAGSALVYTLMHHYNPAFLNNTDWEFLKLATNIREHGMYADNDTAAYYDPPEALHTASGYMPLYPLLLVPFVYNQTFIFVLNWLLHALLIVATFRLSVRLRAPPRVAFVVCALFALEPYHLVLTNEVLSEMLFALLLITSVFALLHYIEKKALWLIGVFALLLGLSTLTRPSAEFLFPLVIALPFFIFGFTKKALLHGALGAGIFVLVLAPWLLRNYSVYHIVSLSSLGTQQMLNAVIPHFAEWQENGAAATQQNIETRRAALYVEAATYLGYDISNRFTVDLTEARIIQKNMVTPFIQKNYLPLSAFYLTQFPFQLLTDNWRTALENMTKLPYTQTTPLSAALAAAHGDFSQLFATFRHLDPYLLAFVGGKLYWLVAYAFALVGAVVLWRRGGESRIIAVMLVCLILYFPFVSLPYLESRYRFPSVAFVFVLASVGASIALAALGQKLRRAPRP